MAASGGACLYREARLNIEPAYPGSTISFVLPANASSTFLSGTAYKRTIVQENDHAKDENAFAKRHLASDGSIFFRRHHQYPRSFLWRILDGRKTLEIQSADLDQDAGHHFEANLTLLFHFKDPIRPFCLAFAEPENRDALSIFAFTSSNDLYTLNLHRDFFIKPVASELPVGDWCNHQKVGLFETRTPFRLVAIKDDQLLVSQDDGGIARLTRPKKDDIKWHEVVYQHTSWGSVRGLISWKREQTVRFNDNDLQSTAAAAIAISPDDKHILTVSLNHKLRAWNVESGKPGLQVDLLGGPERPNDKSTPYLLSPSQPRLMAVLPIPGGVDGAEYHVVTYSPKQHQFKFWGIRDADSLELGAYDAQPDVDFIPPVDELMNTTVWTLEEFYIIPGPAGWRGTGLWIRARSGPSSKVYSIKFDLNDDPVKLANVWKHGWVSVDSGPLSVDSLKQNPANPSEKDVDLSELYEVDLTESWLQFLFYPGRFSVASLEAALRVFQKGLPRDRVAPLPSKGSLKERIYATIAAFAASQQDAAASLVDFTQASIPQWQAFYGLVKDLHKRRGEYLSLVFDFETDVPWIVQSDYLTAIRQCSDSEAIALNGSALIEPRSSNDPLQKAIRADSKEASRLLTAAASFRRRLPSSFQDRLRRELNNELLQSPPLTIVDRMELLEQNIELSQQVSDEDLSALVEDLGTDVKNLTNDTFYRALETLLQKEQGKTKKRRQIARTGLTALVKITQETLEQDYSVLLDLLVLILFMQFEEELSDDFEASEIFSDIILQLKDWMIQSWLASTVWSHQSPTGTASEALMAELSESWSHAKGKFPFTQTVLEGIFASKAFDGSLPKGLKAQLLTYWSRIWLGQIFSHDQTYDGALEDIMGILLAQKEYQLAADFSRFLPAGNWATYLKGRMYLALGEVDLASISFQKPAYNLALGMFSLEDSDTINFIPIDQRDSFSDGLPKYYSHIAGLFEKCKAYSTVADFAHLGLRSLTHGEDEALRTDLLSRLFIATIHTSQFEEAYVALTRHNDVALRFRSLQTLITTMVQHSQADALLKFPFVGLVDDVDTILSSLCQKTLNLSSGPQYHQILYAFRISRNNFRGAASILYERLQRLKTTSSQVHDPADQSLTQCYLMIINTLSSVSKDDAYILAEQRIDNGAPQWGLGQAKKMLKRQIITLDTLRKEYQAELDRVEAIENGQYPFVDGGDEMDIL